MLKKQTTMNCVPFTLTLLATSALGFAQATPATPSSFGTASTGSGTSAAAKPKPLAAADKSFVKSSAESLYYLTNLAEKTKRNANSDAVKTLGGKLLADFNKAWGDIGTVATNNGEVMPSELKGSDKSNAAKLGKADGEKFDKEFLELTGKELKKLSRSLETGVKMTQHADLKAAATTWAPAMKSYSEQVEQAEKELVKK
jgi:putative membrane protein